MDNDILKFLHDAENNRKNFLENKFKAWAECKKESGKAKIIIELIQLEPSHLAEAWILNQVILWLKDYKKNIDYIREAFITKGKRNILTERQRENLANKTFLEFKVKKLKREKGSQGKAIREFVLKSDDDNIPQEAEMAIKQRLMRYRKKLDKRTLPYPYYGLDIVKMDKGTEQERLVEYIYNKPIQIGDAVFFGNTTIKHPIKK
jgi:hypothetical protein